MQRLVFWGGRRYDNCEMRTVVVADGSGESAGLDPLWFPGGHKLGRSAEPLDNGSAPGGK